VLRQPVPDVALDCDILPAAILEGMRARHLRRFRSTLERNRIMYAATALSLSLLLTGLLPAQSQKSPAPDLRIEYPSQRVEFRVTGAATEYLGAVLLSLDPTLTHSFQGLPPILTNFIVLGVGPTAAGKDFIVSVRESMLSAGILYHAQGLLAGGAGVRATPVRDLVLDVTVPQ
jgi:hypothetical protein